MRRFKSCASSRIVIGIAIAVIHTEFRYFACFRMRMKESARHVIINQPVFCVSAKEEAGHKLLLVAKCNIVKDGFLHSLLQSGKIRIRLKRRGRSV